MEDLRAALEAAGWRPRPAGELPDPSPEPFALREEQITWRFRRAEDDSILILDFQAFGDLGQRTDRLQDILFCVARDRGLKLYFDKRQSRQWKENLAAFVDGISRTVSED